MYDMMPHSPLKSIQHIRGACHLQLHGRRKQHEAGSKQSKLVLCLAYSLTVKMEVICSSEHWLIFNGLHGVISQMIILFITTTERTLNPTSVVTGCN
jgi:hypothetical protein